MPFISLVQINSINQKKFNLLQIEQINSKLNELTDLRDKIRFLDETLKHSQKILYSLQQGSTELYNTYVDSIKECEDRYQEFQLKINEYSESYLESKTILENIKSNNKIL